MATEDLKTCYTCLHKVTSLTDLLDEDSDNITFLTKLSKFCTIEVIPEIVGICSDCVGQLQVSYKFLDTVTTSQEVWKDYFAETDLKTEEIVIVNETEYVTYENDKNNLEIEEAENSSCYNHPSNHDDHRDADSKPKKENDNNFKCANCSKIFSDEEFLFHGCFKDAQNNVGKSNEINRNIEPKKDSNSKKKVYRAGPNSRRRNNVDYNNFKCATCLNVFSYKEFSFHGCFKDTHSKDNKTHSNELKKVKNTEANSDHGNNIDDNNFECAKCLKVFSDEEFLFHGCFKGTQKKVDKFNNHNRNTTPKVQLNSQCRNDFNTDSNNLKSDINIFKCVKCSKVLSGEEFIVHSCYSDPNNEPCKKSKVEIDIKPKKEVTYECMTCQKSFETRFLLHLHLSRAHKGNKYRCNICEKDFKKSLHLKQHLTLHTGVKYFSCEICEREFRLMSAKQRHMRVHTTPLGERTKKSPFLCNICGRHFPFSNGYQRHMNIHLGIKRHECKVCNRRFRESTHLKVHMRTHTGEKPYMCDLCGQTFSLRASLRKHIGNIHNNKSGSPNFNFMCCFCGENFSRNVELDTHISRVHSDENI